MTWPPKKAKCRDVNTSQVFSVTERGLTSLIIWPETPLNATLGRSKTLMPPSRPRSISTTALARPGSVIRMVAASPLPSRASARSIRGSSGYIGAGCPGRVLARSCGKGVASAPWNEMLSAL